MDKHLNNDLLLLGVTFLIIGLSVGSYSYSTYKEIKNLDTKIDFEMIDNNNSIPTMEKYYKYISYADYLNQKLAKNQNIPIKNTACIYLDYAQHNAIELYNLTDRKIDMDESKKFIATENIRTLYNMLGNYKTCKKSATYKSELDDILKKIEKKQNLYSDSDMRLEQYLNNTPVEGTYPTDIQEPLPAEKNQQQTEPVQEAYPQQPENIEQTYQQEVGPIPQN